MPPHPHRPPELAWQVFRGSDVIRRGLLTRHQLRGASWIRLRQDVYADARLDRDHALACRGALLRLPPGTLLAGPSAAYLLGVEHAAGFRDDVHVLLPATVRADAQPGVRVHQAPSSPQAAVAACSASAGLGPSGPAGAVGTIPGPDRPATGPASTASSLRVSSANTTPGRDGHEIGLWSTTPGRDGRAAGLGKAVAGSAARGPVGVGGGSGLPSGAGRLLRSAPAACAWETAVWSDPVRAVGIIDALLRMGLVSRTDLAEVADRSAGRPGGRRARWVFGLADPGAQSPPESHLRVRLVLAGLPRPVAQHPVRGLSGTVLHPDLAWPQFRVAVEHDGQWHADSDQLTRDRYRRNQLVAAGWLVLHVTGRRLHREFPALVREIRAALVARGWRP
ncbi:endonuclease domain-containing protein [Micromonospora sp. CA-244673]|uniref:endonuclease domain-containing protein n=1 Tax=Micromonospora sp. CA-244673 TaxID=3239958 RepID=UPI003D92500F